MRIWLIYERSDAEKNRAYIQLYDEECRKRGLEFRLVYTHELTLIIRNSRAEVLYKGVKADLPDVCVCRARDAFLSKHLEEAGVRVYNHSFVTEICNDKAKTHQYLAGKGIPMLDTCCCTKNTYAGCFEWPVIVKSVSGHGGSEVFLATDQAAFQAACSRISSDKIVVQPLASESGKDLRVYVIGNEIVAAMLRQSDTDFRSNYSLGGTASIYTLSMEERQLVEKVTAQFQFGLVGIDFIFHDGQIYLNEIEDVVGARMLYRYTDINIVERYVNFIIEDQLSRPTLL